MDDRRCNPPSDALLFEYAFRSFFSYLTTHVLGAEVDTDLSQDGASLLLRAWWLLRYFNPVNLLWRYYSILAYRVVSGGLDKKQIALINFESFPYQKPPIPYILTQQFLDDNVVGRLEMAGILSSQGLLSIVSALQGTFMIHKAISANTFNFLANITQEFAILGLFRAMVSPWIATKVYIDPFIYPHPPTLPTNEEVKPHNRLLAGAWLFIMSFLVFLSIRAYIPSESNILPTNLIDRFDEVLYNYITFSALFFHSIFVSYGAHGLANRNPLFDHWSYQVQTALFLLLFMATFVVAIVDFIQKDFYRNCIMPQ